MKENFRAVFLDKFELNVSMTIYNIIIVVPYIEIISLFPVCVRGRWGSIDRFYYKVKNDCSKSLKGSFLSLDLLYIVF